MEIARQFHPLDEESPWIDCSSEGRLVYWMRLPGGLFGAIGVHAPSRMVVFSARGDIQEADAFVTKMKAEGATVRVSQFPFDPPLTAEPPPGTKGASPVIPPEQIP